MTEASLDYIESVRPAWATQRESASLFIFKAEFDSELTCLLGIAQVSCSKKDLAIVCKTRGN